MATSGDLKSRHKGWFVAKKHAFVMKIFATKTLSTCGVRERTCGKCELLDTLVTIPKSSTGVCISITFLPSAFILCTLLCVLTFLA